MWFLIGLVCGGSFIWTGFTTLISNSCSLVTFGGGGRIIKATCWEGYKNVPHALTGGWAGTLSIFAGVLIMLIGVGAGASRR